MSTKVAAAFGLAAKTYEQAATAQAQAADGLTRRIAALALPSSPRVLEIGCGTGLLTRRLLPIVGGQWLVTDLAPEMVATARENVGNVGKDRATYRVMDGEHPDASGPFDLIVSSLAAQWFADLPAALARLSALLAPGGRLMLTTLGAGSFAEWRAIHRRLGLECGTHDYPRAADIPAHVEAENIVVEYADGRAFLTALKRIGAGTPRAGYAPLTPGSLRRVLAELGSPALVTYEILYVTLRAEG